MSAYELSEMIRDPRQFIVSEDTRKIIADNIKELEIEIATKDAKIARLREALQKIKTLQVDINGSQQCADEWMREIADKARKEATEQ